ncbi:uncharacterized protein LOC114410772 [Glycine soja]|uniref:uncharacterized protein n=1 Tax=Glycine max TaxID=3847 RepID=UPI0003DEAEFB|nr:uncharacterized protein LOC102661789 [Glycine max]XP_028230503.1 uncharacterized protein LOC114410772 [Glycine soja]|eukprot:XP_014630645.2 uncharacterized protein LOC102661789 [Glycine max]
MGDFNNIRDPMERMKVCQRGMKESNIQEFNEWIDDMEVEEAPWIGRKFTWFRPNGIARSKLDRFLVSPKWLTKWPGSIQHPLDRNFFGHCLVLLRSKVVDWGPKPFRVQDCWLLNKSFKSIVKECWLSQQQSGWGGFVLKEKIKKLKERLKTWNRDRFGDTLKKYKKIEGELNQLEVNLADRPLSPQQMIIRKQLQEDLWIAAQSHESLLRQKARATWVKEGDCNSRFFHLIPKKVNDKLVCLQCRFLWGGGSDTNKIGWIKWDTVCLPKEKGGLGIKDISTFNMAMLGKWRWNLFHDEGQLWAKILVSKYGG